MSREVNIPIFTNIPRPTNRQMAVNSFSVGVTSVTSITGNEALVSKT